MTRRRMTAQQFIAAYNRLGVRFEVREGKVMPVNLESSHPLRQWVEAHGEWLAKWVKDSSERIGV